MTTKHKVSTLEFIKGEWKLFQKSCLG